MYKRYRLAAINLQFVTLTNPAGIGMMNPTAPKQNSLSDSVYATAFANMDQGFCILEKVDKPADHPIDFQYIMVNPAFEKHSGLKNVTGKTIREVVPGVEESVMVQYGQVSTTGQSVVFKSYTAQLDLWTEVNAFRISERPAQIGVLFTDITERKRGQEAQEISELICTSPPCKIAKASTDVVSLRPGIRSEVGKTEGMQEVLPPAQRCRRSSDNSESTWYRTAGLIFHYRWCKAQRRLMILFLVQCRADRMYQSKKQSNPG